MFKDGHSKLLVAGAFIALFVFSGCSGGAGGLTAEEILANASQAMLNIESVGFSIERDGEPPVIDASTNSRFISLSGFYQAPDTVQAIIRADTILGVQDLGLIWSPEGNTMTIPGLGQVEIPEDLGFDPVIIFGPEGIPATLTGAISDPTLGSEESFEGVPAYHISGTASGEALSAYTAGTVEVSDLSVDLYIDRETFRVAHITLTEDSGDSWLIALFSYNEEVVGQAGHQYRKS